jgi:hypothetical protein
MIKMPEVKTFVASVEIGNLKGLITVLFAKYVFLRWIITARGWAAVLDTTISKYSFCSACIKL